MEVSPRSNDSNPVKPLKCARPASVIKLEVEPSLKSCSPVKPLKCARPASVMESE